MRVSRPWSIRTWLLLLVLSVWLPAVVALGLLARTTYQREALAARDHMQQHAEAVNRSIQAELDKASVLAQALGASHALQERDIAAFHAEALRATAGTGNGVVLVDRHQQVANTRTPRPQTIARMPEAPFVENRIPDVFFAPRSSLMQQPVVGVFAAESHVNPPAYNVVVSLDPAAIQRIVAGDAEIGGEGTASVVDRQHRVIARSRDPGKWLGVAATGPMLRRLQARTAGFGESVTLDGVASLSYISRPNAYGWQVVSALPLSTLQRRAQQLTLHAVVASGVLLLIGLGLALYAARRITLPMAALGAAATALGRNEVPPRRDTGVVEADAVSAAMHEAGVRLERSSRELEERVEQAVRGAEQAQARLLEAQKHEAIGRLTGGVAHDFNNLLQTISMGLHVVERSAPRGPHERALVAAMRACSKAGDVVRQMLAFGRAQPLRPQAVDVREFLLRHQELTRKAVGERIRLTAQLAPEVEAVHVDPTQLELALLNLVFNARDAMPQGGSITLRARRAEAQELEGVAPGDYVWLEVEDDGPGIPRELQARVFDPYFTTKPVGAGSGLGLPQVLAFARQSGGDVRLSSGEGQGTHMALLLPACARPAAAPSSNEAAPESPARALRILMVEDDTLVSSVVVPALQAEGHTVRLCASGDDALAVLAGSDAFDVVFSDVVMPGSTSGVDLASWCRTYRPALPVLLATGYSAQPAADGERVLPKPYTLAGLCAALQAVTA